MRESKKYDGRIIDADKEQEMEIMIKASRLAFKQANKKQETIIEIQ